jgi:hypothetical protein
MFLVGAKEVRKVRESPLVITGKIGEWLRIRGIEPEKFAKRRIIQ